MRTNRTARVPDQQQQSTTGRPPAARQMEESAMSVAPQFVPEMVGQRHGRLAASGPLLQPIRLPVTEPPFDDEVGGPPQPPIARYGRAIAGSETARPHTGMGAGYPNRSLARAPFPELASVGSAVTSPALRPPTLRLLPGGRVRPTTSGPSEETPFGNGPLVRIGGPTTDRSEQTEESRLAALPDPRPLGGQVAQAVVEVLSGDRPLSQLLTWLDERIYTELSILAPRPPTNPAVGRARASLIRPQDRPKVRSVHVSRPAPGVAEVAARVQTNGRSRAVALRLEEWRGRWRCCALVVG